LIFDKGYVDYRWYERLTQQKVFFVTRMRTDAAYEVIERRSRPKDRSIRCDQVIRLGSRNWRRMKVNLRRVKVWDAEHRRMVVLLTNHLEFAATTISEIYRQRWQIELFFRALKQCLRVKTFVGTSANALKIQIWTALITMLVLKYLQWRARFGWSLSNMVALLRQQLFVYRDLFTWLDEPFEPPPALQGIHDTQLSLSFSQV
jgi:IS4 transposase